MVKTALQLLSDLKQATVLLRQLALRTLRRVLPRPKHHLPFRQLLQLPRHRQLPLPLGMGVQLGVWLPAQLLAAAGSRCAVELIRLRLRGHPPAVVARPSPSAQGLQVAWEE